MKKKLNMLEIKELIENGMLIPEIINYQSNQELNILINELKEDKTIYFYKIYKNRILILKWNL